MDQERFINKINHNKNLHGEGTCRGLTGFYKGKYYREGTPQLPKELRPSISADGLFNIKGEIIFVKRV